MWEKKQNTNVTNQTKNKRENDRNKPGYIENYISIGVKPTYLDDMKIKQNLSQRTKMWKKSQERYEPNEKQA